MRVLRFILLFCALLLYFCNGYCIEEKIIWINGVQDLSLITKPNVNYIIKGEIDLEGSTLQIPRNSTLKIKRGSLKNGRVCLDNTSLNCKDGAFKNVALEGTISNRSFMSSWIKISREYHDLYAEAIRVACNSNADFIFTSGSYKFKHPIFLYNKMSLIGNGKVDLEVGLESPDGKTMAFIIAGNDSLNINGHVNGREWEGNISRLNIIVGEKQDVGLDAIIGLYNASNCSVSNCVIDASKLHIQVSHFIGAYNNARFANPSGGHNIHIYHNRIICQGSIERAYSIKGKLLSCESIGAGDRSDIIVEDNYIINASDDLGIHSCEDVLIRNNTIDALDGRIYLSGSQNCTIENNQLRYISPSQSGMGIKVTIEHSYRKPTRNIIINNNIVDYTKASNSANYGIWVQGYDIAIVNNTLISNGASNARIWVDVIDIDDNQDPRVRNKGVLVPERIVVKNNKAKSLYCFAALKYEVGEWTITDNVIEGGKFICNRKEAILENNIIK